jgi:hypothetical protein
MNRALPPELNPARGNGNARDSGLDGVAALPTSPFVEMTSRPIFFRIVPDRNPRTECGCQPVAFISSLDVAPPGRFHRSRIVAALLPSRAESLFCLPWGILGPFFAGLAFVPDLAFLRRDRRATCASGGLLGGFGSAVVLTAYSGDVNRAFRRSE